MSLAELVLSEVSQPFVQIIEQPCKSLRFRYKVEGRPALILGISNTPDNKIPFSIQISGYTGRVQIVVSCVTKDEPYRPHPNLLVGQHCKNGYYFHETKISPGNSIVTFPKIRLQCVKRNQVTEELETREKGQVDPFITGFAYKNDIRSIDLNVVRLAFQVFLVNENRRHSGILNPIVSNPIYNTKLNPNPKIYRLSHCNSYVNGKDDDIILLCTKISRDDIDIKFYQLENDREVWTDYGTFHPSHVYNNTSICFRPPPYKNRDIREPVKVFIQLVRPSDGAESASLKFEYLPLPIVREKRKNPLFDQLVNTTKTVPLLKTDDIFQPNLPITNPNDNLLAGGASWMLLPTPEADSKKDCQENLNLSVFTQSWMVPQPSEIPKKNSLPNLNQPWTIPHAKKNSLPNWMELHASEEDSRKDNLPAFAELLSGGVHEASRPIKIPRLEGSSLLMDNTPWAQHVPHPINDINKTESESRRGRQDVCSWNIQEDFVVGTDANIDSASGISKILDMDCNQIHLEPFNISSGDLEMGDVNQLSGSLKEHLNL